MSGKEKALVLVQQKEVDFYGDELTAVRSEDGTIYIPIRPVCRLLGLSWDGQRRRIQRDPILVEAANGVVVTTTTGGNPSSKEKGYVICIPPVASNPPSFCALI